MGSLLVVPLGGISVWLLTWVFAIIAGTAYLPVTASFSLLPLLAAGYLGTSFARWPAFGRDQAVRLGR